MTMPPARDNHEMRLTMLERDRDEFRVSIKEISDSLKALVRLEERHAETREAVIRIWNAIRENEESCKKRSDQLEREIKSINEHMPGLKEMRKWLVTGVMGIIALVFLAILGMVIVRPQGPDAWTGASRHVPAAEHPTNGNK